jgi:hypothetical protein
VYDSINHLPRFNDWQKTFSRAEHHLSRNGVFIFDVNTEYKLKSFAESPAWIHQFNGNYLVMKVEGKPKSLTNWNIKVFENTGGKRFRLYEENILEKAFSEHKIRSGLKKYFNHIVAVDPKGHKTTNKTPKIFFVCWN